MDTNQIKLTGSWIAAIGVIVAILAHFGIIFSADQIGQTITDILKVIADLSVIYGIVHQYFVTKSANAALTAKGISLK